MIVQQASLRCSLLKPQIWKDNPPLGKILSNAIREIVSRIQILKQNIQKVTSKHAGMRGAGCGMRDTDVGCGMRDMGCGVRDAGCDALCSKRQQASHFRSGAPFSSLSLSFLFLFVLFVLLVLRGFFLVLLFLLLLLFRTRFVFLFCFFLRIGERPMQCKVKISEIWSKGLQKIYCQTWMKNVRFFRGKNVSLSLHSWFS